MAALRPGLLLLAALAATGLALPLAYTPPGGLTPAQTPQFVVITVDVCVNTKHGMKASVPFGDDDTNVRTRVGSHGCSPAAFFVLFWFVLGPCQRSHGIPGVLKIKKQKKKKKKKKKNRRDWGCGEGGGGGGGKGKTSV